MSIFGKVTWKSMWKNRVRTLVTIAGVILSAAMFTAVTTMAASLLQFLINVEVYEGGSYYIAYDLADSTVGEALRKDEAIDRISDYQAMGYIRLGAEDSNINDHIMAAADRSIFELAGIHAAEGRLPENSSEILLPERVAAQLMLLELPHSVGETITLEILPEYIDAEAGLPSGTESFTQTYTIVGISESGLYLGAYNEWLHSVLTCSDGTQPALWHCYYATTHAPKAVWDVAERIDGGSLHTSLLNYYGASNYVNYNNMMSTFAGILIAIIMVGSVSLIYNAFSISVAERTKQFGLLSSIGATRRQLRRSVFFEAGVLCLLGIPIGLLCGWGGIAVTLHFVGDVFADMLAGAAESGISLRAVFSPAALLGAAVVGIVTVFVSAWIPARRATRVPPMAAIRQSGDYRVTKRAVRVSALSYQIWGLPGVLAKKYYSVSRKKYRATVISLSISIFLFITASSYANVMTTSVKTAVNTENYDIMTMFMDEDGINALRSRSDVSDSALLRTADYSIVLTEDMMSEAYSQWQTERAVQYSERDPIFQYASLYFLEDTVFKDYLTQAGIDPTPYFETPTALLCNKELTAYTRDPETEEQTRYTRRFTPLREQIQTVELVYTTLPQELMELLPGDDYNIGWVVEDGEVLIEFCRWIESPTGGYALDKANAIYYAPVRDGDTQSYYLCDRASKTREAVPFCTQDVSDTLSGLRIGAAIDELPFGVSSQALSGTDVLYFILPMSMAKGESVYGFDMALKTSNYESLKTYLDDNAVVYNDRLRSEMQARNIILLINVFSYGFIILISLICVCNIFNTISTNIALRRRDFGMLRSVGLKTGELYRMMHFECLRYGVKALIAGLPLALLSSYGIHTVGASIAEGAWQPPWAALAVAAGSIFLVVFATMLYAVSKLRRDNPIDAIRMENI